MQWTDYIFAVGAFLLLLFLLPTVLGSHKPSVVTALGTALIVFVFSATFAVLGLWLAAAVNACQAVVWLVIAGQAAKRDRSS